MSSSSSDSDSDDYEPVRKIKINIRPKEEIVVKPAADVSEIRASVEAWRPLGPPPAPHHSLSRRQSSLSSIVSYSGSVTSFGGLSCHNNYQNHHSNGQGQARFANRTGGQLTGPISSATTTTTNNGSGGGFMTGDIKSHNIGFETLGSHSGSGTVGGGSTISSSPSCSSLVNDFNNRSSFANFIYTNSRTSSPSTNTISSADDPKPIAIAIQETIELLIRKCQLEAAFNFDNDKPKYESRSFGNIKLAFSNAFAKDCGSSMRLLSPLRLRLNSTDRIVKYFTSSLIKDLDFGSHRIAEPSVAFGDHQSKSEQNNLLNTNGQTVDPFDSGNSSSSTPTNSRVVELDMEALANQLKALNAQSPESRYYSLDILRYQIAPISSIEACPLQVCAYWNIDRKLIKLRIDFKHPDESGLKLKRLSNISFSVNFSPFIPYNVDIEAKPYNDDNKNSKTASKLETGQSNGDSNKLLTIAHDNAFRTPSSLTPSIGTATTNAIPSVSLIDCDTLSDQQKIPQPPLTEPLIADMQRLEFTIVIAGRLDPFQPVPTQSSRTTNNDPLVSQQNSSMFDANIGSQTISSEPEHQDGATAAIQNGAIASASTNSLPCLTYKPNANWDNNSKQLTWKFESLVPFHDNDKLCSLYAKLDFRHCNSIKNELPDMSFDNSQPNPVDVKFLATDSSLSKMHLTLDSPGYKIATLKREVRSGKYRCEPCNVKT